MFKHSLRLLPKRSAMIMPRSVMAFSTNNKESIDFGFKTVDREEKQKMVAGVFSNVAEEYDVMNDAMSLGVHRIWKDTFINQIGPLRMRKEKNEAGEWVEKPINVLDVAGGTGDISFKILNKAKLDTIGNQRTVDITVSDINPEMLEVGKKRAVE
jgi:2-methoxy-6-polyprenyl-1,4-benzoquinol methylase